MSAAIVIPTHHIEPKTPGRSISVALPRAADDCYDLFCEMDRLPEWLPVVRSVHTVKRDRRDRPLVVAFLAKLERATVGYTCRYRYQENERRVAWSTAATSSLCVQGQAQFHKYDRKSCLMSYSLKIDLGGGALPGFLDPQFNGHPTSAAVSAFRDFALRVLAPIV